MNDERNKTLEELYSNYYDSVYRFCMTVTGFDRRYYHLIEDCFQDAFIAAITEHLSRIKIYNLLPNQQRRFTTRLHPSVPHSPLPML